MTPMLTFQGNVEAGGGGDKITEEDAMKFPLVGSAVLFGLFVVLKFVSKEIINYLLSIYFSLLGVYAIAALIEPMFGSILNPQSKPLQSHGVEFTLPLLGPVVLKFTYVQYACMCISTPLSVVYFVSKPWVLNNLLGVAFAVQGIQSISLGSFKVGAILLSGLFFYDIFWVFGTDKILTGDSVMVTVAKSLDAPIKLLFPKAVAQIADATVGDALPPKPEFSMLGLGDIVIPGLFVAMLLRFDAERANADPSEGQNGKFHKPFFYTCLAAYALGLGATVFVMEYFKAAQPALLYLVPACLGAALLAGLIRGQVTDLFAYSEEDPEPSEPEAKKEK